jgi:glutaredoxin/uncharacterized membrane protein YtjA (UPF0391 family)
MKKILFSLILVLTIFMPLIVKAEDKINVYAFVSKTCPACAKLENHLNTIKEDQNLNIIYYEVANTNNEKVLVEAGNYYKIDRIGSVPLMIIGDKHFSGYAENMNPEILLAIEEYQGDDQNIVELVAGLSGSSSIHGNTNNSAIAVIFIFIVLAGVFLFAAPKKKI